MEIRHRLLRTLLIFILSAIRLSAQTPPVVPAWAFKHIVWEDNMNTREGAELLLKGYKDHSIPVEAIIIDSPWSTSYNNFNWDEEKYPDPSGMLSEFAGNDIRVILWLTGAVNIKCKDTKNDKAETYDYVVEKGYGINGSQPHDWWKGRGVHIDFTNKDAVKWWGTQLDKVFSAPVYGWKCDQGEYWFGDILETSAGVMGNADFRHWYYDAMYDYTVGRNPEGITISRPYSHQGGFAASPDKVSIGWCGDFDGDWRGLKRQIDNIYRSSLAGYGAVACEVAGFYGKSANREQFVRYAQFGCMTSTMINGGENGAFTNHLPWYHGEDVSDIYRDCVLLHDSLVPYLFSTSVDNHLRGGSLIRNMSFSEESHMLGDCLFTKAITSDNNEVSFTLPSEGMWIDWWTGKKYSAGEEVTTLYPLDKFPLFVKSGSVLPMFKDGKVEINVYPDSGDISKKLHLPVGEGVEYVDVLVTYKSKGKKVKVEGLEESEYVIVIR